MELELAQNQRPKQIAQKHLLQSMTVLQMDLPELRIYLSNAAAENPLLEFEPPLVEIGQWNSRGEDRQETWHSGSAPGASNFPDPDGSCVTLKDALLEQLLALHIPRRLFRDTRYLIYELDDRGFLSEEEGIPPVFANFPDRYEEAVKLLQSLEPCGVGARNLGECLCLQLQKEGITDPLPYRICSEQLERLGKGQLSRAAKDLGVSVEKIRQALKVISDLTPYPSNGFASGAGEHYVLPDVEVSEERGELHVATARQYLPSCKIDRYYENLLESDQLDEEAAAYLREMRSRARELVDLISRRTETILLCAGKIAQKQRAFFLSETGRIEPLTMAELAEELGISVSTVSRAISGKYLLCAKGVYPLRYFIRQEVNASGTTEQEIVTKIRELILQEPLSAPFSDQLIAEKLADLGISISRRTVAKYRDTARIPAAHLRRKAETRDL